MKIFQRRKDDLMFLLLAMILLVGMGYLDGTCAQNVNAALKFIVEETPHLQA